MQKLVTAFLLLLATPAFAQILAIRAGAVVDPAHATVAKDQVILVEHGRILSVGTQAAVPDGAERIYARSIS